MSTDNSRRGFLKGAAAAAATLGAGSVMLTGCANAANEKPAKEKKQRTDVRPNILLISCDQLAWKAVGQNGNKDVVTPAIDSIMQNGASFDRTYCTVPLCKPSRASFWTSLLPHKTKVRSNEAADIKDKIPTIGSLFSKAGYETKHFGKTHDVGGLRGFDIARELNYDVEDSKAYPATYQTERDAHTVEVVEEYLAEEHDKPFIMCAEFYNPHNINNWIGKYTKPHGDIPGMTKLPPLLDNYATDDLENRPLAIQYLCGTNKRQDDVHKWTDQNYQQYLNAYYHYTNLGDQGVARVLEALYKSDVADNTLIVFMSDHGDGMGAHKLVAKSSFFYEEATRVPFVLSGPGIPKNARFDAIASLADLMPTLCDYAGIKPPKGIYGRSLLPVIKAGGTPVKWRDAVVCQWHTARYKSVLPARMLATSDWKYMHWLEDGFEELYDLKNDPGEKVNLAKKPEHAKQLKHMQGLFAKYLKETKDPYLSEKVKIDPKWREGHDLGYHNHFGGSAMRKPKKVKVKK